jgi:hypothetical protein
MGVGQDGMPGSAGLHLAAGVPLLHPGEQVFSAMLEGWRAQQLARNVERHDNVSTNDTECRRKRHDVVSAATRNVSSAKGLRGRTPSVLITVRQKVRRASSGPGLWPGPCRQARTMCGVPVRRDDLSPGDRRTWRVTTGPASSRSA